MNSIVEEAKKEVEQFSVAYAEFILDYKKDSNYIYCFYEGKDDRKYYSIRTQTIHSNKKLFHYDCNGKENVVKINGLIKEKSIYSQDLFFYFIDKDFDENKHIDTSIYVTPYYSIENFYTIEEAFENILVNEFNIPRNCECFQKSIDYFTKSKSNFHSKIIYLNAYLYCVADYRNSADISFRLNIDDSIKRKFSGSNIFENIVASNLVDINIPTELLNKIELEKIFTQSPHISQIDFDEKLKFLENSDKSETFRGKFELHFLISFLKRFQNEICKKNNIICQKKYKCSLRFEYATSLSQLTNNAITKECLIKYLKQ